MRVRAYDVRQTDSGNTSHTRTTEATLPTRRQFEMTLLVVILAQPALACVRLWLRKHQVTASPGATTDAAAVAAVALGA